MDTFHIGHKGRGIDRLLQVTVTSGSKGFLAVTRHGVRGHRNDRHILHPWQLPQCPSHVIAIHPRQLNIQKNAVKLTASGELQAKRASYGVNNRTSGLFE